jgi:membrane protein DedA with SNARE-associated domain
MVAAGDVPMRTTLRLYAATLIAFVSIHAVAYAETFARYNEKGEMIPEPTTTEKITHWVQPENVLAVLVAAMLPGMRKSVFFPFAGLALYGTWKFAARLCFGYYLLIWLMSGANDVRE